ncbi:tripartite tricarboxylate transporter substrate binding protein [Desulfopila sp. IMCC35008]|uniref:Bug family tripartite tricarboxylate transporter substrate binding protein n=1 Tax=Desulfopila sp. IMCC35008 TaxID=2653858 RepID=UPI0013D57D0D|nr:tripartite tricarboxylate transporter substrate binding protein [Desulfopila sp. IMCC35008]
MKKLILTTLVLLFAASSSLAADFPSRTLTFVIPFGAGGETDIVARVLAKEMEKELGVTVAPKNIVGASGMNGVKAVVSAKPDGYTLGVIPSAPLVMHPHMRKLPYNPMEDLKFVGRASYDPYLVLVRKDAKWNTLDEMVSDMKENPGKFHWASAGAGSVPYFAGKDLFKSFELDVKHVPFKGDAGALQAIAADRVAVYTTTAGVLAKHDVKALAILAPEASSKFPEITPVTKSGKEVFYSQFVTLVAPSDLPEDIMATLSEALAKVTSSEGFVGDMEKLGMTPAYLDTVATNEFIAGEFERNAKNIQALMEKK